MPMSLIRKKLIVKIVLIIIAFLVVLMGITRRTSRPTGTTVKESYIYISTNGITAGANDVTNIQSHGSTSVNVNRTAIDNLLNVQSNAGSKSANARHTCDMAVKGKKTLARRFPHIIIIGFGKAGTRALYQMIRMHPDVVGPSNEIRFFSDNVKYNRGIHSYARLMPATTSTQKTIEKSPDYIIRPVAAERLKKALVHCHRGSNEIKFIVVLREPFKRTISEYLHWKLHLQSIGRKLKDFERMAIKKTGMVNNVLAQVNTSVYSYHVRNWLKVFDMEQMCFVDGDNLVKNPYSVLKKLEICLELRDFIKPSNFYYNKLKGYYCPVDSKGNVHCLGSNKGRTHPIIDKNVELKVRKFFEPYNKELYELIGVNFGWT